MAKADSRPDRGSGLKPGHYSDGHPLDEVQYLECKIILKPDPFKSVDSFREFGKLVRRTARDVKKVEFIKDPSGGGRPAVREVVFLDTPDFGLYNNAFILRRRIAYADGFPAGAPEIVFKFRHPDLQKAAELDVRPNVPGRYRIKFKAEVLPLRERLGGFRILYSHNCEFALERAARRDSHRDVDPGPRVSRAVWPARTRERTGQPGQRRDRARRCSWTSARWTSARG